MHDHVAVVEQYPARVALTLGVQRFATELLEQLLAQVLENSARLPLAARRADDEVVSDERYAANVEQDDVTGQLVRDQVNDSPCQAERLGRLYCRVCDGPGRFPCQCGVLPPATIARRVPISERKIEARADR